MQDFLVKLGAMSVQSSLIILVVLVLRKLFKKINIAKKYSMLLWIVPFFCLIFPWKISVPNGFWKTAPMEQSAEAVGEKGHAFYARVEEKVRNLQSEGQTEKEEKDPGNLAGRNAKSGDETAVMGAMDYNSDSESGSGNGDTTIAENNLNIWNSNTEFNSAELNSAEIKSREETKKRKEKEETGQSAAQPERKVSVLDVLGFFWIIGVAVLLVVNIVRYLKLKKKLLCSIKMEENIYIGDDIATPMVVGVFRPRIYIPTGLPKEFEKYVLEHERTHIRRWDTIIKMAAYVITCIHWFNPLVWLAFHLFSKDMEMTCDEETISRLGMEEKESYAEALLGMASGAARKNRLIFIAPMAFEEGDVKRRIKNVVGYKKTMTIVAVAAVAVCAFMAGVFLTKDGKLWATDQQEKNNAPISTSVPEKDIKKVMDSNQEDMDAFNKTDDKMKKHQIYQELQKKYEDYKSSKYYIPQVGRDFVNKLTAMRAFFRGYYTRAVDNITGNLDAESKEEELKQAIETLKLLQDEVRKDESQTDSERYRYEKEIVSRIELYETYIRKLNCSAEALKAVQTYQESNHDITDDYYTTYLEYVKIAYLDNFQAVRPEDLDLPNSRYLGEWGYHIVDLDSDGVKELVIGIRENPFSTTFLKETNYIWILAIYTIQNGKMVKVLDGSGENRYFFCEDGVIRNSAESYIQVERAAFYKYKNGKLDFIEAVFYDSNKSYSNPYFYNNQTDTMGNATAISEEKAKEINNRYKNAEIPLTLLTEEVIW